MARSTSAVPAVGLNSLMQEVSARVLDWQRHCDESKGFADSCIITAAEVQIAQDAAMSSNHHAAGLLYLRNRGV